MGSLGPTEIILIVVAALVLFGAKRLPEIGKSLGKGLKEFKKATKEITNPLDDDYDVVVSEPKKSEPRVEDKKIEEKKEETKA